MPEQRQGIMKLAIEGGAFRHDPAAFRQLDIEFHQTLYDAGGNRMLAVLGRGLYHVGLEERRVASAMHRVIEKSLQQHCEVAEAIISGVAESAVSAYRQHLEHVRDAIVQSLAEKAELGASTAARHWPPPRQNEIRPEPVEPSSGMI
jgi:GntR family transcriptional repressor for pyruvate dehydrogenase complex